MTKSDLAFGIIVGFWGLGVGYFLWAGSPNESSTTVEVQVCASIPLGRGVLTRCCTTEVEREVLQEIEEMCHVEE